MKAPHFWSAGLDPHSREAAPLTRALLTPLAALYAVSSARRIARTEPFQSSLPVLCIGNITSGGSGKTPSVLALSALLKQSGLRPAILARGYGGRLKGPVQVDPETHSAADVGDEPLMMAIRGETVWISRDRPSGARRIADSNADIILMDDGHQNPTLFKDMSLLVVDAAAPFGNGYVIPKGPLREPVSRALARADAILLIGEGRVPQPIAASGLPVFRGHVQPRPLLSQNPMVAFAGIGRPERFFQSLEGQGAQLCETLSFADHYRYRRADLRRLRTLSEQYKADLITTEKDYIRLPETERYGITVLSIEIVFDAQSALVDAIHHLLRI